MTGDDIATAIGSVALALVVGFTILCSVIGVVICCYLRSLRRRVQALERKQDHGVSIRGTQQEPELIKLNKLPEYSREPLPGSPASHETQQLLSPKNHTMPPSASAASTKYDTVHTFSLLPKELRTTENLMGGEVPEEQVKKLLEDQVRNVGKHEYEECITASSKDTQSRQRPPKASPKSQPVPVIPSQPGYEDVPDPRNTDYHTPADAVKIKFKPTVPPAPVPSGNTPPAAGTDGKKRMKIAENSRNENDEYSDVFDSLPPGEAERVGGPKKTRTMSDSSPNRTRFADVGHPNPALRELENEAGVKPSSLPSRYSDESEFGGERGDKLRQSQKQDKEIVEFDSNKRKFKVSQRKVKGQGDRGANEYSNVTVNGKDVPDGGVTTVEGDTKEKTFECSEEALSYAKVNVADKKMYRPESDGRKSEGSGVPQHYSPAMGSYQNIKQNEK